MDSDEATQATQNVLDPRRLGKQNSGFSDEDISDIICVLYPASDSACQELRLLAQADSPHIIGKDEADGVEPDYALEDEAGRFQANPINTGNHAIILRLSAQLKNPHAGFAFGRNAARCDLVFLNDPRKRISNVHFRIYVNEYGTVMIEDQSTNGTFVDRQLLTSHPAKDKAEPAITRWVLSSGNMIRIYLHEEAQDLTFRVRIPRRDDEYDRAYTNKVDEFFAKHGISRTNETITPGPTGHVDLFRAQPLAQMRPPAPAPAIESDAMTREIARSPSKRREPQHNVQREWTGSGKYNRTGIIGKGAFAVVHKVTSKYDGKPYAAKELDKRKFIKNGVLDQKVENEMRIMQKVSHPNIVKYIENFDWDNRLLIIIMEYVSGGDLGKYISENDPLEEMEARQVSNQLLGALGYLHANNITHRDVKPDNILINRYDPIEVKLTDFGLSKMVDTEQTFLRTFCGTLLYCAPEVYTEYAEYDENGVRSRGRRMRRVPGQRYNHAVDIWSLGGVLFYALTGSAPYPVKSGISYSELLHKIMTTPLNIVPLQRRRVSDQAIDFLHRMLQNRPENRATVSDLETHPWSGNTDSTIAASQSYDVITDDEDLVMDGDLSRFQRQFEEDRVSDSIDEESEKENYTIRPGTQQPRLFGEVGVSAIGSSGVIPEDFLNLPGGNPSLGETEILGDGIDAAYQPSSSAPSVRRSRRAYRQTTVSIAQNQSEDQLQSLVEEVASQSLGGDESAIHTLHTLAPPNYSMQSAEFNTTKRKPPPTDTSDEFDENTPTAKSFIKRLKSGSNMDRLANDMIEEFKLLAKIPQVRRSESGRQIDNPVSKMTYWEKDIDTWHLDYPEMTQLQNDAFSQAARDSGEEFGPDKTPLWELAMKYFPPMVRGQTKNGRDSAQIMEFPSTAPPTEVEIPDTLPPDNGIVVPVADSMTSSRLVGMVESHPDSSIKGISFSITDSLTSFGRGLNNTEIFQPKSEIRVPKYALKILLWKDGEGYDPAKDPSKVPHPWHRDIPEDPDLYHFYLSTKATWGIMINGYVLPSSDVKNPGSRSRHWTRIYNGDSLLIWGNQGTSEQTRLTFRCFWGGSSRSRGEDKSLRVASAALAEKLDIACRRTEKRIRDSNERRQRVAEAKADLQERKRNVVRERERSNAFEVKRQEAISYLLSRQAQAQASRRASPASAATSAPPTTRLLQGITLPRANPDSESSLSAR